MKSKRKFIKTSPFEENMQIDIMEDVYVDHRKRWRRRLLRYLFILGILFILVIVVSCSLNMV